jgi:putative selenium metabolism protein SsnA
MSQAFSLSGGTLLAWSPAEVRSSDLHVVDGRIATTAVPGATRIDCTGCLVVPGVVVAHTHLYSGLARGMPVAGPPPTTFREILERVWWRLDLALDAESLAAAAEIAAIEAAKAGATCLFDHHESPSFIDGSLDVVAQAIERVGLRGVLCYGATDRHGPAGARAGLEESARFARSRSASGAASSHSSPATTRGMIGLHAPFTCSTATLESAAGLARDTGAGLHLHAAEGPDDQRDAALRFRKRLFLALDGLGLLGPATLVAHAVGLDRAEADLLAARGSWVAHQARSNMNNGVGYAGELFGQPKVALGTDGIDNDLLAELKVAFFRGREHSGPSVWRDPIVLLARGHQLLSSLTGEPAFGSLSPAAPADVVVLAYDPPTPLDAASAGSHLLFGLSSLQVRDVFVAGRPVVRDRALVGLDEREAFARGRAAARALFARMERS